MTCQKRTYKKCSSTKLTKNWFLSGVWSHMAFKEHLCKKDDLQMSKENDYSVVCVSMYFKEDLSEKAVPKLHKEMVSLQCVFACDIPNGNF